MAKSIDFKTLDVDSTLTNQESAQKRWTSRDPNPTVQMSLRMPAAEYDKFRALCKQERRTNGGMLEHLVDVYLKTISASQKG